MLHVINFRHFEVNDIFVRGDNRGDSYLFTRWFSTFIFTQPPKIYSSSNINCSITWIIHSDQVWKQSMQNKISETYGGIFLPWDS